MKNLNLISKEQASEKGRQIFESIEKSVGMLPNIYAVIGNSTNALESYMAFAEAQKKGSLNAKEREAVALAVSEENGCNYCRSAHTAIAKIYGFTEEETLDLRAGTIKDEKLNVLTNLTKSLINNRGDADENLVKKFYEAGYDETALVDLVFLVAEKIFTTYIGRLSKLPIDFPVAKPLNLEAVA